MGVEETLSRSNDLQFFYSDVVHDFYNIATTTNNTVQTTSFIPKGFNGQTLQDLILAKRAGASTTLGTKVSTAMNAESIMLKVNGISLLPQNVNTHALIKSYLQTTKVADDLIAPIASDVFNYPNTNNIADATASPVYGFLSYMGVNINQLIASLAITYQRTGSNCREICYSKIIYA